MLCADWVVGQHRVVNFLVLSTMIVSVGVLYGTTSVAIGHPLDTIKTKMQAQAGFERSGMWQTFVKTLRTQGVVGLYRWTNLSLVFSLAVAKVKSCSGVWNLSRYRRNAYQIWEREKSHNTLLQNEIYHTIRPESLLLFCMMLSSFAEVAFHLCGDQASTGQRSLLCLKQGRQPSNSWWCISRKKEWHTRWHLLHWNSSEMSSLKQWLFWAEFVSCPTKGA